MISAFRQFVGSNAMMAYLVMMAPRLVELPPHPSVYQAAERVRRPQGRQARMDEAV